MFVLLSAYNLSKSDMLSFLFNNPLIFAIVGCLLIAWDISKKDRNPFTVILGLGFLALTVLVRFKIAVTEGTFFGLLTGISSDLGFGLLASAGYLAVKRSKAKPFFVLGVLSLGLALTLSVVGRILGIQSVEEQSFLLELGPDDQIAEVSPILDRYDVQVERAFPLITLQMDEDLSQVYLITGSSRSMEDLMDALREDLENVDHIALNMPVQLDPPPQRASPAWRHKKPIIANDPLAQSQWALEAINAPAVHDMLREREPVRKARVAILDTGVDAIHEDINTVFSDTPGSTDKHGHGTHCAGIAGAATNNDLGMASLNWNGDYIEILSYRALGADGMGSLETIAQAILDAARNDADVISMSLGGFSLTPPKVIKDAVDFAIERGAIVVAAAGNSNQDARNHMPSNIEGVISVSAIDQNGNKAKFSNTNTGLTRPIAAPGVDVVSLIPGDEYGPKSGTSMATPVVSGLIGIMRAFNPDLPASEAYRILHETGVELNDSDQVGRLIDADAALQAVLELDASL